MSGNFTIVDHPVLGRLTYHEGIKAYVASDLGPHFALSLGPDPALPDDFDKLSWKALENLSKQHQDEANEELAWQRSMQDKWEMHTELAADYNKRIEELKGRLVSRQNILRAISKAIAVHESGDTNPETSMTPAVSSDTATMPSNAFITKEDMRGEDVEYEDDPDVKKALLANRLRAFCIWRGGRIVPLLGLPHTRAARFEPPHGLPEDIFVHDEAEFKDYMTWNITCPYMIRRSAPLDEILIYTDGSCLNQHISGDATQRKAGCAVIFKPKLLHNPADLPNRAWKFRLESRGPTGEIHPQTSNRAELRAAIAALQTTKWADQGWIRVTIATDSAYVVEGITENIGKWRQRDWRNAAGKPIANRDLWEKLLSQVNLHAHWGCQIRFWLIPRAQNTVADSMAKYAAEHSMPREDYFPIMIAGF